MASPSLPCGWRRISFGIPHVAAKYATTPVIHIPYGLISDGLSNACAGLRSHLLSPASWGAPQ
jgi:hypothetical protein